MQIFKVQFSLIQFLVISLLAGQLLILEGCALAQKQENLCLYKLPKELDEASGGAFINDSSVAIVQDEEATIFIYDLSSQSLKSSIKFGKDGDFEDIVYRNNTYFVLESNGKIHQIKLVNGKVNHTEFKTGLSNENNPEGLCFSPFNRNELIIACKGNHGIEGLKENKYRAIYSFNLKKEELKVQVKISLNQLKKDYDIDRFQPSAIGYDKTLKEFIVLSAVGQQSIFVSEKKGISKVIKLPKNKYPQPEGLFLFNGTWHIVSEKGNNEHANIRCFEIN